VPYGSDAQQAIPRADVVDLASITPTQWSKFRCRDAQVQDRRYRIRSTTQRAFELRDAAACDARRAASNSRRE
jgi:hypothetical protein